MLWTIALYIAAAIIATKLALDWLQAVEEKRAAHDGNDIEGGKQSKG